MMSSLRRIYASWFPIISILLLGAYLRLYRIADYLTFLGDEGRDVLVVKRMLVDGKWTLLGPTASVGGFYMGPIYYYFMLPFLWIWRLDPVGPAIMVALFGIATIYLLYKVGNEWFGRGVGMVSSLLFSLSPLVISYSRSSWNPNLVPFFSTLLLYLCYRVIHYKEWKLTVWIGIVMGIGIQLHYTFLFLFPVVAILLLVYTRTKEVKWYAYGLLGFIIGFAPFLAFEIRHAFANTRGITAFIFAGKDTGFALSHFIWNLQDVYFRIFGRLVLRIPDGGMFVKLSGFQQSFWTIGVWSIAIAAGIIPLLFNKVKKLTQPERIGLHLLYIWVLIGIFFFGIYKKSIYDYYFGIFFVTPFLFTGLLCKRMWNIRYIGKPVAILAVFALAYFNWQGRPFIYEPNRQLDQAKKIAQAVLDKTNGAPFNFALITGGNSDHAYRYFFEIWGHPPVTIENSQIDPDRKTTTEQLLVVCEDIKCEPLGSSLWEVAGFGRAEIAGSWDVSVVKVYRLIHYNESVQK